jgi:hypothetical protein
MTETWKFSGLQTSSRFPAWEIWREFALCVFAVRYTKQSAITKDGAVLDGVADGARTHDNRNHNPSKLSSIGAALRLIRGKFQEKSA